LGCLFLCSLASSCAEDPRINRRCTKLSEMKNCKLALWLVVVESRDTQVLFLSRIFVMFSDLAWHVCHVDWRLVSLCGFDSITESRKVYTTGGLYLIVWWNVLTHFFLINSHRPKAKIHYTSVPVASPQQVCNKLARAKVRCVCCVGSFPKFHYNDLLRTCWLRTLATSWHVKIVCRVANKSAASWQLPVYGETWVMDFEHYHRVHIVFETSFFKV